MDSSPPTSSKNQVNLLDLPPEILEKILSFLDNKEVAHLRPVCRQMDQVCQLVLTSNFRRLQGDTKCRLEAIKSKMPKRESARAKHPLAVEFSILSIVHSNLSVHIWDLEMAIQRGRYFFFAGEILDEVKRIFQYIKITPRKKLSPSKATINLIKLTHTAAVYFRNHIKPTLPIVSPFTTSDSRSSRKPNSKWRLISNWLNDEKKISSLSCLFLALMTLMFVGLLFFNRETTKIIEERNMHLNNKIVKLEESIRKLEEGNSAVMSMLNNLERPINFSPIENCELAQNKCEDVPKNKDKNFKKIGMNKAQPRITKDDTKATAASLSKDDIKINNNNDTQYDKLPKPVTTAQYKSRKFNKKVKKTQRNFNATRNGILSASSFVCSQSNFLPLL